MRLNAIYNKVWNRTKVELTDLETALLQVEILPVRDKKKYISTGLYLTKLQWDNKNRIIINHPLAAQYNKRVNDFITDLQRFELTIIDSGRDMDTDDLNRFISKKETAKKNTDSFIEFAFTELEKMRIAPGVHYLHERALNNLKAVGVTRFSDLNYSAIQDFDIHIRKSLKAQTSVSKQHSVIKTYISLAQKKDLIPPGKSPYNSFHVPKGKSKIRIRLDDKEIELLETKPIEGKELNICRDAYLFQVYTGLSYKDLLAIKPENIRHNDDGTWIEGLRKKNDEFYTVFLIDQAIAILKKYNWRIPLHSSKTQNVYLKVVAAKVGIDKPLTSHSARHSAASWMLRKGIPVGVIQQILGHSTIDTTMIYLRLEKQTIKDYMEKLSK